MLLRRPLFLMCGLFSPYAVLACALGVSEADVLKRYPESKILRGDLNSDGIGDIVIAFTEQQAKAKFDRIAVYEGQRAGGYCPAVISGRLEYGKADFDLRKGSLFLTVTSNSINESVSEIYQFKYRNGRYLLIGSEESVSDASDGSWHGDSKNFLTGKRIEKTQKDGRTTERATSLPPEDRALVPLDRFER